VEALSHVTVSPLLTGAAAPATPARDGDAASIEKAAKDFESVLVTRMLEAMRQTVGDSGLLESAGSAQIDDLFWHYLGQEISQNGSLGLWKQIGRQMGLDETPPARLEVSA
jgi:Rod binding domain-containing protein